VTIGDSSFSNITYDIHLNDPDSLYEPCVLEPLAMNSIRLDVADSCGDGFLRGYLNHDPKIFDELIIIPNPTHGANSIETSFDLKAKADVSVTMFDALGKAVHTRTVNELPKGQHLISIPISSDPEGVYFIELEAQGTREMRKVVIAR
jgi:hypothetical protein